MVETQKVKGTTIKVDARGRLQVPAWLRAEQAIVPGKKYSLLAMENGSLIYQPKEK